MSVEDTMIAAVCLAVRGTDFARTRDVIVAFGLQQWHASADGSCWRSAATSRYR